ncbi:MAG: hypothetical protein KGL39_14360 [Patescibacteria group bacterium]|nr:hypothetical protein [Patescibacteria group bacterium]
MSSAPCFDPPQSDEWYWGMVDECRTALKELEWRARSAVVEGYHHVGALILAQIPENQKSGNGLAHLIDRVARDIGKSTRTIQYAVKFAALVPDLEKMPAGYDGKDVSWRRICHELIEGNEPGKYKKKEVECPSCHLKFVP